MIYILVFCTSVFLGFYLLSRARRTFLSIRPEWLRRNLVTYLIGLCFFLAIGHLLPDFRNIINNFSLWKGSLLICFLVFTNVNIPYNLVLLLTEHPRYARMEGMKHQVLIFLSIVLSSVLVNGMTNIWLNGSTQYLVYSAAWSFYIGGFGAMIYLFIRNNEMTRQKLMFEKELELSRLNVLKTKAELDVLHSRINPHFLYNALNSIADLSLSDGKKARNMTISLAELFRYSMNYSGGNYATVAQEVDLAKTYLDIEKIRFEDRLDFRIEMEPEVSLYRVPRFTLQPLLENAVKHGLRITGRPTTILLRIVLEKGQLLLQVHDSGPPFPDEIIPGYGLKSVFDKLELLFPGQFAVQLVNQESKYIEIRFLNPLKNEPQL